MADRTLAAVREQDELDVLVQQRAEGIRHVCRLVMPFSSQLSGKTDAVEDGVAEHDRLVRRQIQRALARHPDVEHPDAGGQLVAGGVGPTAIAFALVPSSSAGAQIELPS